MTRMMKVVAPVLRAWNAMIWRAMRACGAEAYSLAQEDLAVWLKMFKTDDSWRLLRHPQWVSLLVFRGRSGSARGLPYVAFRALLMPFPRERTFHLFCPALEGGCFIGHGFATMVSADRIGRNFFVDQQVTVGKDGVERPSIGDSVQIHSGAKVIGGVTLGDGVIVGANAVVLRDVPAGMTVFGVPTHHYGQHREWIASLQEDRAD